MGHLILVGFMGSGKSKVGRRLAYRFRIPFMDTDKQIEAEQGKSISKIFKESGENYFRGLETNCLKALLWEEEEQIISTGGGLVVKKENREFLNMLGTVIYLKVSPMTVYERLRKDTTRPLLQGEGQFEKITRMMAQRSPYYEATADFIIDADGKSVEDITEEICNLFT